MQALDKQSFTLHYIVRQNSKGLNVNRLLLRDKVQPIAHTRFSRRSNFRNSQSKWKKAGIPWPHSFPFLILSYHWSITETVTVKRETPAGTLLQTAFLGFVLISDWPGGLFFSLLSLLWLHRGHINSDSLSNRSLQPTDNKGCVAAYISFSLTLPTAGAGIAQWLEHRTRD